MSRNTLGRKVFKGRGTFSNPPGRFERQDVEEVHDGWHEEDQPDTIATSIEADRARGIITRNDSPDIPFEQSINPYRVSIERLGGARGVGTDAASGIDHH